MVCQEDLGRQHEAHGQVRQEHNSLLLDTAVQTSCLTNVHMDILSHTAVERLPRGSICDSELIFTFPPLAPTYLIRKK